MGRSPLKFKKKQLKRLAELVEAGATKKEMCELLKVSRHTLNKYLGDGKDGEELKRLLIDTKGTKNADISAQNARSLKKAWNNGLEERYNRIKNNIINTMDLKTRPYEYDEVKTTYKVNFLFDEAGNPIYDENGDHAKVFTEKERIVTNKVIMPSDTMTIFCSKNLISETFQQKDKINTIKDNENDCLTIEFIEPKLEGYDEADTVPPEA